MAPNIYTNPNKKTIYAKTYRANYLASKQVGHFFVEHPYQWLSCRVLYWSTDSPKQRWLLCFYGKLVILWCNSILPYHKIQENWTQHHIFYLHWYWTRNIFRQIRDNIPTKLIEVNIESTGIAQEQPVFFDTKLKRENWKIFSEVEGREEDVRSTILTEPPIMTAPGYYANNLHKSTTIFSIALSIKPCHFFIETNQISFISIPKTRCWV